MRTTTIALAAAWLFTVCGTTLATEGRIPIFKKTFLDGTTSNIEGQYTVVRNITGDTGPTIRVEGTGTERVEINLNGFTVERTGSGPAIFVSNVRIFVVRNGSVTSTGASDAAVHIENTSPAGEVIVESLRVSGGGTGIRLSDVPNFRIRENIVSGTNVHGIQTLGTAGTTIGGVIERNQILGVDSFGIWVGNETTDPEGIVIRGNRVHNAGNDGILIKFGSSFIIDANTVTQAGNVGIKVQASRSGRISGNVVSGCGTVGGGAGIVVINSADPAVDSENNLVIENVTSGNLGFGMTVAGTGNRIQGNIFNGNGSGGLRIGGDDNTFGGNTGRNNTGTPTCGQTPPGQCASPDYCDDGTNNSTFGANFMPGEC